MPSHPRWRVSGPVRKNISFAAILVLAFASLTAHAAESDIIGDWSGVLSTGRASLHLLLHVSEAAKGGLNVTLDSLDQGAIGLPGSNAVFKGDRFTFEIPSVSGSYGGTVSADSKTINGTWTQRAALPLVFEKIPTKAHKPADVVGEWNATVLLAGDSQRTTMHVKADPAGHLSATLDSINDHVNGIVTKDVALSGSTFSFNSPAIAASYRGLLADDNKSINGTLNGGGVPIPFVFNRYEEDRHRRRCPRRCQRPPGMR